jgi:AraC family transcriptional regulator
VNLEIVQRNPARVAAMRYVGPFGEPLGRFWRASFAPWLAEHGLLDCPRYGVAHDNPTTTLPAECRYDCCVELPAGVSLPDMPEMIIPGGAYAVARFKGTGAAIGAAWKEFIGACFARGLKFDTARLDFEHYPRGATVDTKTGVFACELCFPVSGPTENTVSAQ